MVKTETNAERQIAFAQSLVRRPSLSGEERVVVKLIMDEMRALGFDRVWTDANGSAIGVIAVSYTHLTLPTNREV